MSDLRFWIPLAKPQPYKTFFRRTFRKWGWILRNLPRGFAVKFGFVGARLVNNTSSENEHLKLNKTYALGYKGFVVELPRDKMIYSFIKNRGSWELEESEFLASGLKKAAVSPKSRVAFLDIGANSGLVSLQAINLAKTQAEVFLFEPIPRHILAIKHNFQNHKNIHIENFALSHSNGKSEIFTENFNHGNSSMLKSVVEPLGRIQTKVKLVNTKEYCDTFLIKFDSYVIKCDTQGMDALILSRVPNRIWAKVQCAIIEIWALPEISGQDVDNLLLMCQQFKFISWHPGSKEKLELIEIKLFWTNNSKLVRNLYLSKN